jgi:lipopolysaccharide export system protein LptC
MANPPVSTHSPAARSPAPRSAEPRPAAPRSAEPRSATPRSAEPRSAQPRSAEPRSAEAVSAGRTLIAASDRTRRRAHVRDLERRRHMIMLAKWVLPAVALALLCTVAAWPEVERLETSARIAGARVMADVAAARVTGAVYHSIDAQGRPYTLTATVAQQDGPERINLTTPKGDITLQNGTWMMVKGKQGVFIQHKNLLDLSHDVTLYRDDGTTLVTASASLDLTRGAAAGADPVHAEGPFGTLDAQGGFTATDKGTSIEFAGPATMVLNGATPGGPK